MKSSIALTTYNGSRYIIELLESINNQTRKPDEVIIIDDVSTDDTVSIVKAYIKDNDLYNWKIIKNDINIGWKKNFRKAIDLCNGDIIFFCDQDDIWHKDKLEIMCCTIEQNKSAKVLVSNYVLMSQGSKQKKGQKGSENNDGKLKKLQGPKRIGTISRPGCTFAFTKEIADIMKHFDNFDCAHDHVVYNLGLITDSLYIINRQLIDYRRHTDNASTSKIKFGKERKSLEAKERVNICDILINYCKSTGLNSEVKTIQDRKDFYSRRFDIFKNGNLFNMIGFVISNMKQYWSLRDMIVDLAAMIV